MCKICDESMEGGEVILASDDYIRLTMKYSYITARGDNNAGVEIKYCPFCGKYLEDNE